MLKDGKLMHTTLPNAFLLELVLYTSFSLLNLIFGTAFNVPKQGSHSTVSTAISVTEFLAGRDVSSGICGSDSDVAMVSECVSSSLNSDFSSLSLSILSDKLISSLPKVWASCCIDSAAL